MDKIFKKKTTVWLRVTRFLTGSQLIVNCVYLYPEQVFIPSLETGIGFIRNAHLPQKEGMNYSL